MDEGPIPRIVVPIHSTSSEQETSALPLDPGGESNLHPRSACPIIDMMLPS